MKISLCALILAFALILPVSYAQASAPASPGTTPPSTTTPPPAVTSGSTPHHPGPCHADVQKFCSNVQKGGGRVLACLKQHEGQLSPQCEAGMKRHESNQSSAPTQAPSSATQPSK